MVASKFFFRCWIRYKLSCGCYLGFGWLSGGKSDLKGPLLNFSLLN